MEALYGAHPCGVYGYYDMDAAFISEYYNKHSRTQEAFEKWADEWIMGVPDHKAYLNKLGAEKLTVLRANSALEVEYQYQKGGEIAWIPKLTQNKASTSLTH